MIPAYSQRAVLAGGLTRHTGRFALDLVEVFFQIVHSRLPLLNPAQFRSRLHYSLYSTGPPAQVTNDGAPQGTTQRGRNSNSPPHGGPQQKPLHPA